MRLIIITLSLFLITCGGGSTGPEEPKLPIVQNINLDVIEDTPKTFVFVGTDPLSQALSYSVSTQPQHGTISISGGAGTYTPNANYNGEDLFLYIASSVNGNSNIGTVAVTIFPEDDDPNSKNMQVSTDEDTAIDITLDIEEYDGDNISVSIKNNPQNGSVSLAGSIATYIPNENYFGSDNFTYEAIDQTEKKVLNVALVSLTINPINDSPIVEDISGIQVNQGDEVKINLIGTDVENENLSFNIIDSPNNGSVSISNNIATYNSNIQGDDSFTYQANDGTEDSNVATVSITVSQKVYLFGGTGKEMFNDVIEANDGGFLAVGYTDDSDHDIYIVKTNSSGTIEWEHQMGSLYKTGENESAYGVIQESNGDFVVTGQARGYVSGGIDGVPGGPGDSVFLTKIDQAGNILWEVNDGAGQDHANISYRWRGMVGNTIIENNGEYFVFGKFYWGGVFSKCPNYSDCSLFVRYNSSGQRYDNGGDHTIPDSYYQTSGEFMGGIQTSDQSFIGVTNHGGTGEHIMKFSDFDCVDYNVNGTLCDFEWDTYISDSNGLYSIIEHQNGDLTVYGEKLTNGSSPFYPVIYKLDSSGSIISEESIDVSSEFQSRPARGQSIEETSDGGLILIGNIYNTSSEKYEVFVIKKDSGGSEEWSNIYSFGSTATYEDKGIFANSIEVLSDGSYVIAGKMNNQGDQQAFLMGLDSDGNRIF